MSQPHPITIRLDRRILEHPRAHHLRRMRVAIWLYLDLLARLPAGAGSIEVEPAAVGRDMGLREGTIRSWLGHLRKAGYVEAARLNGKVRVSLPSVERPTPTVESSTPEESRRFFTVAKIQRALGEKSEPALLDGALERYPDEAIKRALAGTLAVPPEKIRRSRTALFIYLLKHHEQNT